MRGPGRSLVALLLLLAPAAGAEPAADRRIVVNIPALRLRLYEGPRVLMDVPVAVGRHEYPGEEGNTRTRVGSYRIVSWHQDYRSRDYPIPWSRDPWRGAFGKFTAKLGPRASYQYLHGTVGPEELGDWLIRKLPVPDPEEDDTAASFARRWRAAERGMSHGCVRLSNRDVSRLRELAPVGTAVEKIYCLRERRAGPEGETFTVTLPNLYRYHDIPAEALFHVATGALEGYRHPPGAVGPR